MVLNRDVLIETGWLERPLLDDRIGARLVSGGDVEIAQRLRSTGRELWFTPDAVLRHQIPPGRTGRAYFLRINAALGVSDALVSALTWPGDYAAWRRRAWSTWRGKAAWGGGELARGVVRRRGVMASLGWCAFALGYGRGVAAVERMALDRRAGLMGAAANRELTKA
jgi:hypothetical protein